MGEYKEISRINAKSQICAYIYEIFSGSVFGLFVRSGMPLAYPALRGFVRTGLVPNLLFLLPPRSPDLLGDTNSTKIYT
jgi:hypothetical protein